MPVDVMAIRQQQDRRRQEAEAHRAATKFGDDKSFYKLPGPPESVLKDPTAPQSAKEVTSLFYWVDPGPDMGGFPYLEFMQHHQVGPSNKSGVCLEDPYGTLARPELRAAIAQFKSKVLITDQGCPPCRALRGERGYEKAQVSDRTIAHPSQLIGVVPFGHVEYSGQRVYLAADELVPWNCVPPRSVFDALCGLLPMEGDFTNPDAARLVRVAHRISLVKGGRTRHDYTVALEPAVFSLPPQLRERIAKAREPGGDLDLWRLLAALTRSPAEFDAFLHGSVVERTSVVASDGQTYAQRDGVPLDCYGVDTDPKAVKCQECGYKVKCAAITRRPVPPDLVAPSQLPQPIVQAPIVAVAAPPWASGAPTPAVAPPFPVAVAPDPRERTREQLRAQIPNWVKAGKSCQETAQALARWMNEISEAAQLPAREFADLVSSFFPEVTAPPPIASPPPAPTEPDQVDKAKLIESFKVDLVQTTIKDDAMGMVLADILLAAKTMNAQRGAPMSPDEVIAYVTDVYHRNRPSARDGSAEAGEELEPARRKRRTKAEMEAARGQPAATASETTIAGHTESPFAPVPVPPPTADSAADLKTKVVPMDSKAASSKFFQQLLAGAGRPTP